LNDWELYVTRLSIADNLATMSIGLVSAGLAQVALTDRASGQAGGLEETASPRRKVSRERTVSRVL